MWHPDTVFTKTAKGILEIRNKTVRLSRELGLVFLSIDGKINVGDLTSRSGMSAPQLQSALQQLITDGYIKPVAQSAPPGTAPAPALASDELDFTSPQAMSKLNMEAASRALAAADATKRAQAEARAALDARMRQESEARARMLAEARAEAESAAREKAEETAHAASEEHARAEAEASEAADTGARRQAEARARAASAAVVRAQAEGRARAEAQERANALADSKRAAEEEARQEALARSRSEEQAHARAAAERGASEALEAQVQAMEGARAHHENPEAAEAEAARARVRELEAEAERAREAARAIAEVEGRADEVPQPELDIADRVRQLNARVQAARMSREDTARQPRGRAVDYAADGGSTSREDTWPALQLGAAQTTSPEPIAPSEMVDLSALSGDPGPSAATRPAPVPEAARAAPAELPVVDLTRAQPAPQSLEHEPTALERAMAQIAAKSRAAAEARADAETPAPVEAASPGAEAPAESESEPEAEPPAAEAAPATPGEAVVPTIDDSDPPQERVNIDRAAHDVMAEAAEARRKTETARPPHSAAALTRHVRPPAQKESSAARARRHRKILIGLSLVIFLLPALVVSYLQFVPLNGYIPDVQKALSQRLNQPVTISTLRYLMLPSPRLVLEGVTIGPTGGVRAGRLVAHVSPVAALSGARSFAVAEAHDVEIQGDVLGTIPAWTGGRTAGAIHADRLELTSVTLKLPEATLAPFNGEVAFAPNGTVKEARFASPKVKLELTPSAEGVRVTLDAIDWRIPYGPPVPFGLLTVRGLIDQGQIAAAEFKGRIAGGDIEGALTARWAGPIALQGEFRMERVGLRELLRGAGTSFEARGTLRASGRFSMQAPDWKRLTASPQAEATFASTRGEITNIDVVRAIQSPAAGAMRGGRTAYEELSGAVQLAGGRYQYRNLRLASGPLNASGALDVGPADRLSGRIVAELAGRGARSTFVIRGTVPDPQLQR